MTILAYNQFTDGGYEGQISRNEAHNKRTALNPRIVQQSTVTVTTGAVTVGWTTLVTRTATGETVLLTYDPVDSAGVASATTADAAATLHRTWNSTPAALVFGSASLSGSVVTIDFNDIQAYTVVTTPAGAGAATDAVAVVGGGIKAYVGRWQFYDSTAALAAGDRPEIISAETQTLFRNILGIALRDNTIEQPDDGDVNDFHPIGNDIPVLEFGVVKVRVTEAVVVADDVHIVTSAGVNLGLTASSGGLDISDLARFRHDAALGELVEVAYDLRNVT